MSEYFVHPTSVVDEQVIIGEGTKIWHFCHIQSGAVIGKKCSFGQNVNISNNVRVGDGCKLQNNVSIYEGVELEDYVFCGPSCVFTNDLTPRAKYPKGRAGYRKTLLKTGASIGANATIVCGNTIGIVMKVRSGPPAGSRPKANTAGMIMRPPRTEEMTERIITQVQLFTMLARWLRYEP